MHDIKRILADKAAFDAALARRNKDFSAETARAVELDESRRALLAQLEGLKAEQNAASKQIPALKKAGESTDALMARMKEISAATPELEAKVRDTEKELGDILLSMPNTPDQSVPDGLDAESNVELRRWGTPPEMSFEPKPHWEIGAALGILDPGTAAKVTGARFHFYKGLGARLERAIFNFFLDTHAARGYTEVFPPFMANRASMTGTGQLPKFEEDMFHVENTEYFLIPTAEVPVTNMHRDEVMDEDCLPLHYCAYSACFRAEAGSAGRDTRGLIRQHQFNKVELVKFCAPEQSWQELESLTADAENVLKLLGLPHRTVALCAGDMGFASAKTYDIEVWMPSYGRYVEISSCSNFVDFQARRAQIRCRKTGEKPRLVHTLNGSGVAVGRTVAAILENFQNADGSVTIPEALRGYMGSEQITMGR